jgi:uncharacterized OB-fold protein
MSEPIGEAAAFLPFAPTPDRDSQPYWDALSQGEFKLQRCDSCQALRWPARALCNRCRSFEHTWLAFDGKASAAGWVRTHQVFAPALRDAVPYRVIQVALDVQDDLLLIGGWLSSREPVAGEAVVMEIIEGTDGYHFPCWKPENA